MSEAPYTMAEAAAMLDCSDETVVARIQSGELQALRWGRSWIFPREAFHESLNAAARAEARRRRQERDAKGTASKAISKAKGGRARTPPPLPSLP